MGRMGFAIALSLLEKDYRVVSFDVKEIISEYAKDIA
ncbi:MAG: hypothetical protein Q8Q18_00310 [bacterium]|nr:hypothetical protein [bacterium]